MPQDTIRLGFFLERTSVACFAWPEQAYRGIDRLPYLPTSDEHEQMQSSGRSELTTLWDRYWQSSIEGELNVDVKLGQELQRQFLKLGISFEVIYGEVVVIPTLDKYSHKELWSENLDFALSHRYDVHQRIGQRPDYIEFLGFDISHPVPTFHSAILQPGLNNKRPYLPQQLNSNGLFNNLEEVLPVLDEANSLDYGVLPFCVIGIWVRS